MPYTLLVITIIDHDNTHTHTQMVNSATVPTVNVRILILTVTALATVNLTPPVHNVSPDLTQTRARQLLAKNALLDSILGMYNFNSNAIASFMCAWREFYA